MSRLAKLGLIIWVLFTGCKTNEIANQPNTYLRWVDDIEYDPKIDDSEFKLCFGDENAYQYFNVGYDNIKYQGDKITLVETFKQHYKPPTKSKENGLIRIRFVVNCEGKTGRFRLMASDLKYQPKKFDKKITSQLMEISKNLTGWLPKKTDKGKLIDYYQYLIFKIKDGKIKRILP